MAKNYQSKIKANNKYAKKTYFRATFYTKSNEYNIIEQFIKNNHYTTNGLVVSAVKEKIERMTGKKFDDLVKENQLEESLKSETETNNNDTID